MNTKSFFATEGLTSKSANSIANKAKEYYEELESSLDNINFLDKKIQLLGSPEATLVRKGVDTQFLSTIESKLATITKCKSLIAFLREAIKEKDRLTAETKAYEFPCDLIAPKRESTITQEEIIDSWSIGQQEKYLSLETEAAVLGKYVYLAGPFNRARKKACSFEPIEYTESGRDTIITTYSLSAPLTAISDTLFAIQDKQRDVQKQLDGIKHTIETTIKLDDAEKESKFQVAHKAYLEELKAFNSKCHLERMAMLKEIENLKIVIPNNLREIYEIISKL